MRLIDADKLEERLADKYNGCAGECECCKHYLREKWEKGWCGLIAHAPTVGGWISVKDRLPEKSGQYLVFMGREYKAVFILWFSTGDSFKTGKTGWYDFDEGFGHHQRTYVTHWMPLPTPPEEVQE